jgi:RNA polymerase-binding protein DksA
VSDELRVQLLSKRDELVRRLAGLEAAFEGRGDEADIALAGCSREFHLARRESLHKAIRAIDVALERLGAGEYGNCVDCGNPIAGVRLRVYPDAEACIECQAKREQAAGASSRHAPSPYSADAEQPRPWWQRSP